ncbi:hypothetical protein CLOM_g21134 [Closterium sp. NIES-68]|nr:hypothetical protein CLOM_g21134 [Closterium sp. NIES-68]
MASAGDRSPRVSSSPLRRVPGSPLLRPFLLAAACVACLLLSPDRLPVTRASPQVPWDSFKPPCGAPLSDPPPGGFKLWSDPSTWPGGVVPGLGGAKRANATIPCGQAVLLNVPAVVLTTLTIRGMLKIEDTPSRPLVAVNASFVIVEGQLLVGSSARHFSQKAVFTLTPNPNGRNNYLYTANAPADASNPRNFGHKAFVVVGGQVRLHGMPGGSSTPSWCRLAASARAGDRSIVVDQDVSAWPKGFHVGLSATDFYADEVDAAAIADVSPLPGGKSRITLTRPLAYNHFGEFVPDGFGGTIDERGSVVLLNRTVVIRGEDERAPTQWEGGHFMVFFTRAAQMIEGVEFAQMGQQGQLGRYNIHFHLCGNQAGRSVVRKNVMHDSKQRCVVVHATFNLTVEENVAFNTRGHCFMVEEGGEQGNSFIRNVGIWTRPAVVKISPEETDDEPSTFWISNANNNYIGNVAAGSEDTGFWLELRDGVRGLSLQWPLINKLIPLSYHRVGTFKGNVAHSSGNGFRNYPGGFYPRYNASTLDEDEDYWDNPVWVTISDFLLFKNFDSGAFIHNTDHVVFEGFTAADNMWGVEMHLVEGIVLRNLRAVGQTRNYGNPEDCTEDYGWETCAPVSGCKFPLAENQQGRSVGWGGKDEPVYGLVWTQSPWFTDGLASNVVDGAKFAGFDNACTPSAAVAAAGGMGTYWNAGNSFKNVKFSKQVRTNPVFVTPRKFPDRFDQSKTEDQGEAATQAALRDSDGSIVGAFLANTRTAAAAVSAMPTTAGSASVGKRARTRKAAAQPAVHSHRRHLAAPTASAAASGAAVAGSSALRRARASYSRSQRRSQHHNKPLSPRHSLTSLGKHASAVRSLARYPSSSSTSSPLATASQIAAAPLKGFLVANNPNLLPPRTPSGSFGSCKPLPGANAFACPAPAHCFRTVNLRYYEPATAANVGNDHQGHGAMSFIKVVRVRDGRWQTFDGNLDRIELEEGGRAERLFGFNALVGEVYEVRIVGPNGEEDWQPARVWIHFGDGAGGGQGAGCGGPVTVRVKAPADDSFQWAPKITDNAAWRPCTGTAKPAPVVFSYECDTASGQQQVLEALLSGAVDKESPAVIKQSQDAPSSCCRRGG